MNNSTMDNHSLHNEALINLIKINLVENKKCSNTSIVFNTIFNNTILPTLKSLPCNKVPRSEKDHRKNMFVALKILRKHLPYNLLCFCARNPDCDSLYYAVNDFKYQINSNFYNLFNYK